MKKQLFIFAGLFMMSLMTLAQGKANLVIFSEDGDQFYAYINGVRQNDKPESNVKVTGLSENVSLRVEFTDKANPQLKQTMMLEQGYEFSVRIKRDTKKQLKLRPFGQVPISETAQGVATVQYHSTENAPAYNTASTSDASTNTTVNNGGGGTTVTSSTTTTKAGTGDGNINMSINMSGTGINMNVTGMDPNATGNVMTTTSSTTVTSSSSSSSTGYDNSSSFNNNNTTTSNNAPAPTSKSGCSIAMNPASFGKMKQSIEAKPFSDTKNACLSVNQVKEICKLFSMDDDKLAYAKYAYDYCVDKANYYQVSEVFSFSSTTDDFNKFLEQ
jgi:hypothetical protein